MPSDPLRLARGLAALQEGRYFEAHDEWEVVWLRSQGSRRRHVQGLIQVAAACLHLRKGRPVPAGRLLVLALEKLADVPEDLSGIPAASVQSRARDLASELAAGADGIDPASFFSSPVPPRTA